MDICEISGKNKPLKANIFSNLSKPSTYVTYSGVKIWISLAVIFNVGVSSAISYYSLPLALLLHENLLMLVKHMFAFFTLMKTSSIGWCHHDPLMCGSILPARVLQRGGMGGIPPTSNF